MKKIKSSCKFLPLLGLALIFGMAQAAPVTSWTMTFNGNGDGSITGDATANPVQNQEKTAIVGTFPPMTLADGDSITLSGTVSFSAAALGAQFRWGLFDSTSQDGYFVEAAGNAVTGTLTHATSSSPNYFATVGSSDFSADPSAATEATMASTSYAFLLTLTRNGSEIDLVTSLTGNGGAYSSTTSTSTSVDSIDAEFTFDNVSFLLGGNAPAGVVATYSNIDVTQGTSADTDNDGMPDAYETAHGLNPAVNDAASSLDSDSLTNLQEYQGADGTPGTGDETLPENPDTDGDGDPDGLEVTNVTDPNDPLSKTGVRLFGIDFNRNDELSAPSQSLFRTISGSTVQASNTSSYTKTIGSSVLTVSQPGATKLEFRGGNSDSSRAIPGGDTSLSYLAADFVATKEGAIRLHITNLPAGDYFFRSWHIEPFTGATLGFAQGATTTTPNTIEARVSAVLKDSTVTTALGSAGLNTTFIDDSQIPSLGFSISHAGGGPLVIDFTSTLSNGGNTFLLLNGFEIYQSAP